MGRAALHGGVGLLSLVRHDTDIWSAEHHFGWQAGLIEIPVRMTVIRIANGQLILHSPIPVPPALQAEIEAIGPVAYVVVPRAHGRFVEAVHETYPAARWLAAPSPPRGREVLPFDGSLADRPPAAWGGGVETMLVEGFRLDEVLLYHRPSRSLVVTDLCFNIRRTSSAFARTFFRANGMWRRFGPSRIIRRVGVSSKESFQRSLDRMLEWDLERVIPGHGDVVECGGAEAIRAAWPR